MNRIRHTNADTKKTFGEHKRKVEKILKPFLATMQIILAGKRRPGASPWLRLRSHLTRMPFYTAARGGHPLRAARRGRQQE